MGKIENCLTITNTMYDYTCINISHCNYCLCTRELHCASGQIPLDDSVILKYWKNIDIKLAYSITQFQARSQRMQVGGGGGDRN